MTGFDDREKGFEKKFSQDQESAFRAKARRNHLFGLWAAEQMGLEGSAAEDYAKPLISAALHKGGDEALLKRVATDLADKGVKRDAARIAMELERCMAEAKKQLGQGS